MFSAQPKSKINANKIFHICLTCCIAHLSPIKNCQHGLKYSFQIMFSFKIIFTNTSNCSHLDFSCSSSSFSSLFSFSKTSIFLSACICTDKTIPVEISPHNVTDCITFLGLTDKQKQNYKSPALNMWICLNTLHPNISMHILLPFSIHFLKR